MTKREKTIDSYRMIGVAAVAEMFGVAAVTVRRWVREGGFPKPRILNGCHRWMRSELIEYMQALPVG